MNLNMNTMENQDVYNPPTKDELIILKSVYKVPKVTISPTYSNSKNMFLGIPRVSDAARKTSSVRIPEPTDQIELYDGIEFNLQDPHWAIVWEWVQYSPKVAYEPGSDKIHGHVSSVPSESRYGTAEFYVYRPNKEAERKVSKRKQVNKAENFIFDSSTEKLSTVATVTGLNIAGKSTSDLEDYLLSFAAKDPAKIIMLYSSSNLSKLYLLKQAIQTKRVTHQNGVYRYGSELMGTTEEQCLVWMSQSRNEDLVTMLKQEVNPRLAMELTHEEMYEDNEVPSSLSNVADTTEEDPESTSQTAAKATAKTPSRTAAKTTRKAPIRK